MNIFSLNLNAAAQIINICSIIESDPPPNSKNDSNIVNIDIANPILVSFTVSDTICMDQIISN